MRRLTGLMLALILLLCGCAPKESAEATVVLYDYFDTVVTLKVASRDEEKAREILKDTFSRLDKVFDCYEEHPGVSGLWALNHSEGAWFGPEPELTELLLRWWDEMPPLPGMEDFVREVKANGYKVYLCSNTPDDVYDHFDDIPVLQILDGILASCDFGVAKPDRKIFEALYNKFDLDPAECFFIDDMPQNIEGAAKTGMCGFCFAKKDLDALKSALRENGVRI